jgi:hypothetical protein
MKKQNLACAFITAVTACGVTSVQAQSLDTSFAAFTACDASFFKSIAADRAAWSAHVALDGSDTVAWIKTPDRATAGGNVLPIPGTPTIAGLPLTHYLDESMSLGATSHYYYWGFKVAGTVDSVVEKIKPLVADSKRLRKDGDVFVRTELKFFGKPWLPIATPGGSVPQAQTVERAFLIENDEDTPNTVKVLCSLQGDLSADVLQDLRPDIATKDYPATLDPELFNKVQASDEIMKTIKDAAAKSPLWTPKFKRVTYSYKGSRYDIPVTLVNAGDGMLNVTENYTLFKMNRQMLAGLLQTKSRYNASGAVFRTEKLDLSLPSELNPGDTLSFEQGSRPVPADASEKDNVFGLKCVAGEAFEASKIFSTLPGRAITLQCTDLKGDVRSKAFLEAVGIAIDYTPASGFFGSAKPKYTQFSIEQ